MPNIEEADVVESNAAAPPTEISPMVAARMAGLTYGQIYNRFLRGDIEGRVTEDRKILLSLSSVRGFIAHRGAQQAVA